MLWLLYWAISVTTSTIRKGGDFIPPAKKKSSRKSEAKGEEKQSEQLSEQPSEEQPSEEQPSEEKPTEVAPEQPPSEEKPQEQTDQERFDQEQQSSAQANDPSQQPDSLLGGPYEPSHLKLQNSGLDQHAAEKQRQSELAEEREEHNARTGDASLN
jgi:hypothetical protein